MASSGGFSVPFAVLVCFLVMVNLALAFAPPISGGGEVCSEVFCGKGECAIAKNNSTAPYECICFEGWKQPTNVHGISFLPCVMPNCTIDISCSKATSLASVPNITSNGSIFNPCSWNICGAGTCKKGLSSKSSYSCLCNTGFKNLLNSTSFPCYPECAVANFGFSHSTLPAKRRFLTFDELRDLNLLHGFLENQTWLVPAFVEAVGFCLVVLFLYKMCNRGWDILVVVGCFMLKRWCYPEAKKELKKDEEADGVNGVDNQDKGANPMAGPRTTRIE